MISLDYLSAMNQAKKLDNVAEEYSSIISDIQRQLSEIEESWQGEASEALKNKLTEYLEKAKKTRSEINNTATKIRRVAQAIKDADDAIAAAGGGRF